MAQERALNFSLSGLRGESGSSLPKRGLPAYSLASAGTLAFRAPSVLVRAVKLRKEVPCYEGERMALSSYFLARSKETNDNNIMSCLTMWCVKVLSRLIFALLAFGACPSPNSIQALNLFLNISSRPTQILTTIKYYSASQFSVCALKRYTLGSYMACLMGPASALPQ